MNKEVYPVKFAKWFQFVVLVNVVGLALLYAEEQWLDVFQLVHWVDYAFFLLVTFWCVAGLMTMTRVSDQGKKGKINWLRRDEVMAAKKTAIEKGKQDSSWYKKPEWTLFFAGVPSAFFVLIYHFLF